MFLATKADFNADRIISGEGLREEFIQKAASRKKVKFPKKVMVWGGALVQVFVPL